MKLSDLQIGSFSKTSVQALKLKDDYFYPHIGGEYDTGYKGVKLIILGESYYGNQEDKRKNRNSEYGWSEFTINVINRYIDYKRCVAQHENWMRTYTRFTNIMFEENIDNNTTIEFWNNVIFYNYVQSIITGPRRSPTEQQFKDCESVFFSVLEHLKPDLIMVWVNRLWYNLPKNSNWGNENGLSDIKGQLNNYNVNKKKIILYGIPHPSSRYLTNEYKEYMRKVIQFVGKKSNKWVNS